MQNGATEKRKRCENAVDMCEYGKAFCQATNLQTRLESMGVDLAAKTVEHVYRHVGDKFMRRRHGSIDSKGVELDVIKCYLANMTIDEAVVSVKKHRKVILSRSAIGRVFRRLFLIGIAPPGTSHSREVILREQA